jgi:hypothetical protein
MEQKLRQRILEAATWLIKINPNFEDNFYRSEKIKPIRKIYQNYELKLNSVKSLVENRSRYIKKNNIELISEKELIEKGTLIYTCPDKSEKCGFAELYTKGFMDIYEIPAWDNWICLGDEFNSLEKNYSNSLISYIPNKFINYIYSAYSGAIVENFGWLEKRNIESEILKKLCLENYSFEFIEVPDRELIFERIETIKKLKRISE